MFWEFARVLEEMTHRRPQVIMLENVPGLATSRGGRDLHDAIQRLNELGYACDILVVNAVHFVPQSRARLFIVGNRSEIGAAPPGASPVRPQPIVNFMHANADLRFGTRALALPERPATTLTDVVERMPTDDGRWWDLRRSQAFVDSLSPIQRERLQTMTRRSSTTWRTAYRRTRSGVAVWEVRPDAIAGCLRTAKGGSSKQAVVEAGHGRVAVRWMTPREYAALQGAPQHRFGSVSENKAMFGFGDAVCVPVVAWLARHYLVPLLGERADAA
jgi:DNA (cytosine-5)-methyltransferase 1